MRSFTATEIDLCKKIAEKERKEIKWGDWILDEWKRQCLVENVLKNVARVSEDKISHRYVSQDNPDIIPLWQEHDCLEWLKKHGCIIRLPYQKGLMKKDIEISEYFDGEFTKTEVFIKGYNFMENPLEWLLRAVLAVMEKK